MLVGGLGLVGWFEDRQGPFGYRALNTLDMKTSCLSILLRAEPEEICMHGNLRAFFAALGNPSLIIGRVGTFVLNVGCCLI